MDITNVCNDIKELDQDTQIAVNEFIRICKEKGLPIKIFETYRPQARQDYLYAQGRTRPGDKVTWTLNSFHTTRRAFDVIHKDLLWNAPESFWRAIAADQSCDDDTSRAFPMAENPSTKTARSLSVD